MKKSIMMVGALFIVAGALTIGFAAHHVNPELNAIFESGIKALNEDNLEAFGALHTQDGIHIGVQEGQLEIGWAEYKPRIEQYLAMPAMITNAKPVAAKVVGDTGWGVWTFTNEIGEGDQKMASETRLTLVFEKVDGKWLVSHSHVSAGMPPMAPPSAEK